MIDIRQSVQYQIALFVLISFHLVGIAGLSFELTRPFFAGLTPVSLILSSVALGILHREWNKQFMLFLFLTYLTGYGVELSGVHTGFPFGEYEYGDSLGLKIGAVPPLIGLNWILLIYATGVVTEKIFGNKPHPSHSGETPKNNKRLPLKVLTASVMMVLIDLLIEPVAPLLDFWSWSNGNAPAENFIGWFGVSILLHLLFFKLNFIRENKLALPYLLITILFFISLNIILI